MLGCSNIFEDVDCVYDDRKMKPGLRTGVVEKLNQRVGMYNPAPSLFCIAREFLLSISFDSRSLLLESRHKARSI